MKKIFLFLFIFFMCIAQKAIYADTEKRDPFIPLIDAQGNLRQFFSKPIDVNALPKVALMGISKVNNVFYAIIDGEMLKEGDTYKGLKMKKIEFDRVFLSFQEKEFTVLLNPEQQ